ncbi:MAG: GNAT family N-acetyltransferase [Hyphomicrobiaceae bacterium]
MIKIKRYNEFERTDDRMAHLDTIFFEASRVKTFENEKIKAAFHWRWLGQYLTNEPEHAFLAVIHESETCGYLVGSLQDPALRPAFLDLAYIQAFASITTQFPAHLHINVAAHHRGKGIGKLLVQAFQSHARSAGSPGVHVVTAAGHRSVEFYQHLGFSQRAETIWQDTRIVCLCYGLQPQR